MYGILAIIPDYPSLGQMVGFSLMGFGIVLFVLLVLSFATSIIGLFFKTADVKKSKRAAQPAAEVVPTGDAVSKEHEYVISAAVAAMLPELKNDGAELLAVLTAAASVALEEECNVVTFKEAAPDLSFSREGRLQIFASKAITPKRAEKF